MLDSRLRPHNNTQIQRSTRLIMREVKFLRDSPLIGAAGDGLLILAQCSLAPPQRCQIFDILLGSVSHGPLLRSLLQRAHGSSTTDLV